VCADAATAGTPANDGQQKVSNTAANGCDAIAPVGKAAAADMTDQHQTTAVASPDPRSHRRGHWFEPSIAHPDQRPVLIKDPAFFVLV
jgi:hypothetical protein